MEFTRKPDYELHPAGEWRAQFVAWEEDKHEKFGIQCKLSFDTEVLDDEGKSRRISTWTKPSLHPKGRVAKLLAAIGIDVDAIPDEDLKINPQTGKPKFTLDDYIGSKLRLMIAHEPKKDTPTEFVDRITAFLPFKKGQVRTSASFGEEPDAPAAPATEAPNGAAKPAASAKSATKTAPATAAAAPAATAPNWEEED